MKTFFKQFKKINTEPFERANIICPWIGSFRARAILVYGAIYSLLAQPRNLIGGHISYKLFFDNLLLYSAFVVATSLIVVLGSENIHELGFIYVLYSITAGAFILFIIALLVNNIPKDRHYLDGIKFNKFIINPKKGSKKNADIF